MKEQEYYEYIPSTNVAVALSVFVVTVGLIMLLKFREFRDTARRMIATERQVVEMNKTLLEAPDSDRINALVTGGSGMLGKEIVKFLLRHGGYKVHSLDLFIPEEENRNSEVCSYIQTDITNLEDLCIATKGMDVVFHTAAILPTIISAKNSDFYRVIIGGTENIITACKEGKVKRLIYTSTADVVIQKGTVGVDNTDEYHPLPQQPLNAYVRAKGKAEAAVLAANCDEMLTSALRPGGILELVIYPKMNHLAYIGDKERVFPLVSCGDLAGAHLKLEQVLIDKANLAAGKSFNFTLNISERELDETIAAEIGGNRKSRRVPMTIFKLLTYVNVAGYWLTGTPPINPLMTLMALDILKLKYHSYSCTRAQQELEWEITPWKDVVKTLVREWKQLNKGMKSS